MQDVMSPLGEFDFSHGEGSKIRWKANKDLTKDIQTKTQKNKNTGRTVRQSFLTLITFINDIAENCQENYANSVLFRFLRSSG
jgi:hypothetical protein